MGEAKRGRLNEEPIVWHHTSTLRTNLIWMSGVIQLEGASESVFHPKLGRINSDVLIRRAMKDFPPLAWFTTRIDVPRCLVQAVFYGVHKETGERIDIDFPEGMSHVIALNRVALGFLPSDIAVTYWPEHAGYHTAEGAALNQSAVDAGDDPADWWVADEPVDVMAVKAFRSSKSVMSPKMERHDEYIPDIHKMVSMCRDTPGAVIPPSWLTIAQATELARRMDLPIAG
ncbi:hypothetical protein U1839_05980 [Sphingomonas sp. RT2P30]